MKLESMPGWDKSAQRFRAFWEHEIVDRAIVEVTAPKRSRPKGWTRVLDEKVWADPQPAIDEMHDYFDATYHAGDAYPLWYPNLGPTTPRLPGVPRCGVPASGTDSRNLEVLLPDDVRSSSPR